MRTGNVLTTLVATLVLAAPLHAQTPSRGVIEVPGASLPYVTVGTGLPCIVYGSGIYYPRLFSETFASALRCVHVAERGFVPGATRREDVPFGIMEAVADIEATRRQLGMDRFVMVGHSIHGLVALAYAATYPQHVTHVIAIGAPPSVPFNADSAQANRKRRFSAGRQAQHDKNRLAVDSLMKLFPGQRMIANYVANGALYWADSTFDASALWRGMAVNDPLFNDLQRTPFAWDTAAPAVDVPVLVALGEHDYVVPANVWGGVRTPFTSLAIRVFERAGHTPQYENPVAFDREVLQFIRSH